MRFPFPWAVLPWAAAFMATAHAAEGMWTLDNLPLTQLQARYGFVPGQAWLDQVTRASARLAGGCSASFISPQGLVMTNHHCVADCLQQLSSATRDLSAEGYLARDRGAELRCPDTELNRLDAVTDVTDVMNAATAGKQGADFQAAQDATRARLTSECRGADAEGTRCDLVTLYRGGQYQLYKYHRYSDVRLVWAPEEAIGAFGGDPDNFNFPRYTLDVGMLRAYEGGKPAAVPAHFRINPAGPAAGELVFAAGNPGMTERQLTVAQLEALRDELALVSVPGLSELRGVLLQYVRGDAEARRLAMGALEGIENALKVTQGRLAVLLDPALLDRKRQAEQALKAFVAARPALLAQVGDPWADIARAQVVKRQIALEHGLLEGGRAFSTGYFPAARTLVRAAAERTRPDGQRLREFSQTSLPQVEQRLLSPSPTYPAYEQARLAWSLNRLRSLLGPDDALVRQVLGTKSPEQRAQELVSGTRLGDPAERLRLWNGGAAAVEASDDPFIQLARALDPAARALRGRWEAEVLAPEREAAQRIARASFAQTGTDAYPDATFSLRLSYGDVQGWVEKGRPVPPFTDFGGLYARATGADPYALPPSWLAARPRLDPAQPMNFVATLDTVGGSSGSPVINRQGEIVGLLFDGNLASLGDSYHYDESVNRSVSVHIGAIVQALKVVYPGQVLLDEMMGSR